MTYEGTDTVILYDELAYEDVLPVAWVTSDEPADPISAGRFDETNLHLLQACAALEEHAVRDKHDDSAPFAAELARLDFKLNLVMDLVGQVLARQQTPPPAVPIKFNSVGASWRSKAPVP